MSSVLQMPVVGGSKHGRTAEIVKEPRWTWDDLESLKTKAASAMDRVEYLASTRNKFTEFRAREGNSLEFTIRSRAKPQTLMMQTLSRSVSEASTVLKHQEKAVTKAKTDSKRLEAINRYIVDQEFRTQGKEARANALAYGKQSSPLNRSYPLYDELYNLDRSGEQRELPLGAVSCLMAYTPPEAALRHGMSKTFNASSRSRNSAKSTEDW
eukprot:TRINITY_DN69390_c0_g1_i1.p1 TRINITY_DN69390_c0_g1~~TRINITY_DN69390_c0_g1_i1.p1  ORF type:complete len:211 (-),score=33.37 TRINITY_DN69390_c0_g1_i1:141-773(-)